MSRANPGTIMTVAKASAAQVAEGTSDTTYVSPKGLADAGIGSGITTVTELPTADINTKGKLYLLDREGAAPDRLYVGVEISAGAYRFAQLQYGSLIVGTFDANNIANLAAWLKAESLSALANGAPVTTWEDSSAVGNDASQATAGNQPMYVSSAVNGRPAVRFDGVDDYLQFATNISTGPCTIFVVANRTGASGYRGAVILDGVGLYSSGGFGTAWMTYLGTEITSDIISGSTFQAVALRVTAPNDVDFYENGSAPVNYVSGSSYSTETISTVGADPGASQFHSGDIAEVIIYNRALTDGEMSTVLTYLVDEYGLS